MAYDIYMTIPEIPGESFAKGFENSIEILSYSWGLEDQIGATGGKGATGGQAVGKVQISDFHFVKKFDKASPKLMLATATGKHYSKVTLTLARTDAKETNVGFLLYEFQDVVITSVTDSGNSGGGDTPVESLSFAMSGVTVSYRPQNRKGGYDAPVVFRYLP